MEGTFISRPNRFIANVTVNGETATVHVKNTGRCKELLIPGARVILSESSNPARKTKYDLIAVYKGDMLVNIDSQAPNAAFGEFIRTSGFFGKDPEVHPEHVHGDSRFDFYVESDERRIYIEVKGVTLENDGICEFPDAPTERGLKHLRGLERCVGEGYEAYVAFVVQMKGMTLFRPNRRTDPEFSRELENAYDNGVNILVVDCIVEPDSMTVDSQIPFGFHS